MIFYAEKVISESISATKMRVTVLEYSPIEIYLEMLDEDDKDVLLPTALVDICQKIDNEKGELVFDSVAMNELKMLRDSLDEYIEKYDDE